MSNFLIILILTPILVHWECWLSFAQTTCGQIFQSCKCSNTVIHCYPPLTGRASLSQSRRSMPSLTTSWTVARQSCGLSCRRMETIWTCEQRRIWTLQAQDMHWCLGMICFLLCNPYCIYSYWFILYDIDLRHPQRESEFCKVPETVTTTTVVPTTVAFWIIASPKAPGERFEVVEKVQGQDEACSTVKMLKLLSSALTIFNPYKSNTVVACYCSLRRWL